MGARTRLAARAAHAVHAYQDWKLRPDSVSRCGGTLWHLRCGTCVVAPALWLAMLFPSHALAFLYFTRRFVALQILRAAVGVNPDVGVAVCDCFVIDFGRLDVTLLPGMVVVSDDARQGMVVGDFMEAWAEAVPSGASEPSRELVSRFHVCGTRENVVMPRTAAKRVCPCGWE